MSGPFIVVGRSRLKPGKADAYAAWRTEMFRRRSRSRGCWH
jgi:hypothetical protein